MRAIWAEALSSNEDMEAEIVRQSAPEHREAWVSRATTPAKKVAPQVPVADGGVAPVVLIDWGRNSDGLDPARADPASDGGEPTRVSDPQSPAWSDQWARLARRRRAGSRAGKPVAAATFSDGRDTAA